MTEEVSSDVDYLLNLFNEKEKYKNDQMTIDYNGQFINGDNRLTKEDAKDQPTITINNSNSLFQTLVMIDPDAPSSDKPITGPFIHWIKGNFKEKDTNDGQTICDYMGPGPRPGTGIHRYIFLLYQSTNPIEENQTFEDIPKRRKFTLEKFVSKNQLELLHINTFTVQA